MLDSADDFLGKVTFVTGPEKHCGKTTFMNRAAELARRGARAAGRPGPAVMTVGYDGESRDFLSGARKPAVPVVAGDLLVTAERFAMPCSPEIIDVLPGSSALGRLCIARATRGATVALVGPESNALVGWAIRRMLDDGLTDTVLVDGAINRITQASSMPGARFIYAIRVDQAGLDRAISRIRRLAALVGLPLAADIPAGNGAPFVLDDALTTETAARLPPEARAVVVDDFTKVFLGEAELSSFVRERILYVRGRIEFGGFVVVCRGISEAAFEERLADDALSALVARNPYEERVGGAA